MTAMADGDVVATVPFTVEAAPGAVRVLVCPVPRGAAVIPGDDFAYAPGLTGSARRPPPGPVARPATERAAPGPPGAPPARSGRDAGRAQGRDRGRGPRIHLRP